MAVRVVQCGARAIIILYNYTKRRQTAAQARRLSNQHYKIILHVLKIITRTVKTKILTTEMKPQYESENHNYSTEATVPAQDLQHKPPFSQNQEFVQGKGKE